MRTQKAIINALVSLLMFALGLIPNFIVRKIFLSTLGAELLGLSSLYNNILSYLSLIEMGIGTAIIFSLYRPFSENNKIKVKGYLNYYSRFYKIAGSLIFLLGLALIPFIKLFINDSINILDSKIYFLLYLINTYISYLFSYKLCLLNVSQEGFKLTIANTISKIVIAYLQIIMLKKYGNFYFYIVIQIIINLLYFIILNIYINKKYSWLNNVKGNITNEEKLDLKKNVKALFFHKIGSIIVFGTDSIIISLFMNLKVVSKYNSYNMIVSALQGAIGSMMNSITPSIGNLLVEEDRAYAYKIHKRIFFISFWIISTISITLFNTITQFVNLWLGKSQVLDVFTVSIIVLNMYFQLMRASVEKFKDGSGNYYQDRYAAFFEAIINLISSIVLVNIIGLPGVFIGTFISNITVVFWIKPKITYKYVFKKSVIKYFKMYFQFLSIAMIPLFVTIILTSEIKQINNINMLILNCSINLCVINIFYLVIFWRNIEFKYFKELIKSIFTNFRKRLN